ncbi:hypothetical protein BJX63DRAFT_106798 [Aspergillus granulosus]|uniref:Uncharacterized protein n=1 Tax=Aspergillus granulosus TaxID=176169 RepID=A0ABR4GU48_9EURO
MLSTAGPAFMHIDRSTRVARPPVMDSCETEAPVRPLWPLPKPSLLKFVPGRTSCDVSMRHVASTEIMTALSLHQIPLPDPDRLAAFKSTQRTKWNRLHCSTARPLAAEAFGDRFLPRWAQMPALSPAMRRRIVSQARGFIFLRGHLAADICGENCSVRFFPREFYPAKRHGLQV